MVIEKQKTPYTQFNRRIQAILLIKVKTDVMNADSTYKVHF